MEGERWIRFRVSMIAIALFAGFIVMGVRLAQLIFYTDTRVAEFAERQSVGSVKIHLPRGLIYDRNLNELAVSIEMNSIFVNPRKITQTNKLARSLARVLEPGSGARRLKLQRKLVRSINKRKNKSFVWVSRKVSQDVYMKIKNQGLPGVGFVKETKRFYPKRDIAAKIIGFCGIDNQGLYGLEYYYDEVIRPVNSRMTVLKDALGRPITMPGALDIPGRPAPYDLGLTIDERVQYITEKALERQVKRYDAKGGIAIVMDPMSGEILAIAEQPKYNPNNYAKYTAGWWKPKAVSNAVEPGSTFKLFVVATAIEKGLVHPDEKIDCEGGHYKYAGRYFKEANNGGYNNLTVNEIIAKSSNIGAIKIAEKIGPEKLYKNLRLFGFGSKTDIDLPGESAGLLRSVRKWSKWSLPSISFGQELSVTPIQLVAGVSVFANGGYLLRPRVVKAFLRDGVVAERFGTKVVRKVISRSTAKAVTNMMVKTVEEGTGKRASVPGFNVAGKTGTAQKADQKTKSYSTTKNLSSFIGFFPAENPRLSILVMIDEPKGVAWGGVVAAPVFKEIAMRAARILRIPSMNTEVYEIDWTKMIDREAKIDQGRQRDIANEFADLPSGGAEGHESQT
ncbi:Cell division protein FtsI [Peptidoglycan synthetase] [hydrothermal vent metagenome]|uniref:Cell division protein FtsI [Peptidoglycan synthetase] n=1 Tax=hydrothermal vent metagenome TaxID=652676 RepID=A0A3B1BRG6_9ZZZZ